MGTDLKDQTHLVKRGAIYYHRLRVPAALRQHFGKAELIVSLRTRDRAEAKRLARLRTVKLDQEFAHVLAMQSAAPATDLTREEIDRLAAMYYAHILEEDEEARREAAAEGGLSDRKWENQAFSLDVVAYAEAFAAGRSRLGDTFEEEDFAASYGLKVAKDSPSFVPLMMSLKAAYRKALDALKARHAGAVVETPVVVPLVVRGVPASSADDSLPALLAYWKTQKERSVRSVDEAERAITMLSDIAPGAPASGIQKAHIVSFKDKRLAAGKAVATVRKELGLLRAIFRATIDNEKLPALTIDPTQRVQLPRQSGDEMEKRVPFSQNDLAAIFSSEVFSSGVRPAGGSGDASFWIPLISLWTGARLDEIGQLDTVDVREEQGGWYFHLVHDPKRGRRTKARKTRRAPVAPELIRCGLLEYVQQMTAKKHVKLFPELSSGKGRQLTASFSQWFGRYLRKVVKITDPDKVFHSFRHTFKEAWRECLLPEDIGDAITGHHNPSIGRRYGGKLYPLRPMYEALSRLRFEGLNLSPLHKNRG